MANIKSQKKRNLTNAKAAARNKAVRSYVKTVVRRVNETVEAGDKAAAVAAEKNVRRENSCDIACTISHIRGLLRMRAPAVLLGKPLPVCAQGCRRRMAVPMS